MRFINVTLLRDGVQVIPDTECTAIFRLEKPDGHAVINNATIESNGTITIVLTAQCTAVAGRCRGDVLLRLVDETISTAVFILEVVKSPDVANTINSSDEFNVLIDMLERAESIVQEGETAVFTITLPTSWSGASSPYYQTVVLPGFTPTANTRVDLFCDAANIDKLVAAGVGRVYIVNDNGTLTAYATNSKPTSNITVQAVAIEEYIM